MEGLAAFIKINTDTVKRKSPIPKATFNSFEKRAVTLLDADAS